MAPPASKLKQRIERDTLNKKKIEKDKYSKSSTRTSASEATGPAAAAAALDHSAAGSNNSVAFLRAKSNLEVTHSLTLFTRSFNPMSSCHQPLIMLQILKEQGLLPIPTPVQKLPYELTKAGLAAGVVLF